MQTDLSAEAIMQAMADEHTALINKINAALDARPLAPTVTLDRAEAIRVTAALATLRDAIRPLAS